MNITDVKVFLVDEEKLKAFVSIVLDECFMVNDIKVIQGRDGLFISMPSRRKRSGQFKDVAHPLNHETREWMSEAILEKYDEALAQAPVVGQKVSDSSNQPSDDQSTRVPESSEIEVGLLSAEANVLKPQGSLSAGSGSEVASKRSSLEEVQRRHLGDSYWSLP